MAQSSATDPEVSFDLALQFDWMHEWDTRRSSPGAGPIVQMSRIPRRRWNAGPWTRCQWTCTGLAPEIDSLNLLDDRNDSLLPPPFGHTGLGRAYPRSALASDIPMRGN